MSLSLDHGRMPVFQDLLISIAIDMLCCRSMVYAERMTASASGSHGQANALNFLLLVLDQIYLISVNCSALQGTCGVSRHEEKIIKPRKTSGTYWIAGETCN